MASLISTKPRTNPWNFHKKYWELAFWKNVVFLIWPFWFFFEFFPMKTSQSLLFSKDRDNTFWPRPNILTGSVCRFLVWTQFFCPQKVEKNTLKTCSEKFKSTFCSLLPWAAQTAQTKEFMFQSVIYRPTVYRVYQRKLLYFILVWLVEICKLVLVWRWFGNPE